MIVKQRTDAILPGYRGRIGVGGNIFHKRKTAAGFEMIWQDVLNYGTFPICCSFLTFNDVLGYNLASIMRLGKAEAEEQLWIDLGRLAASETDARFDITTEADIDTWFAFLASVLPQRAETEFAKVRSLDRLEYFLNDGFLEQSLDDFTFDGTKRYELGVIAARVLERPYYAALIDKHRRIADARGSDFSPYLAIEAYLEATPREQLTDISRLLASLTKQGASRR